jgi:transglutaminase/protease-like cytokinesis protein 3
MKQLIPFFLFSFLILANNRSNAQGAGGHYKMVDEYVKSLGTLDTLNMGTISYIVTKKFSDNSDKVRAIFDWITYNISLDCKSVRNGGNDKMVSDDVLKTRKANSNGYAALFQDMCSVVKIRCLTVDGYIKTTIEDINNMPDQFGIMLILHLAAVIQMKK